jgi:hypothetical protein
LFITDHVAYILGYPEGDVRPAQNVTRAEVATVFYRLLIDDIRESNWTLENPFSDVGSDSWYNAAVSVICNMGVIRGYKDGTFSPDAMITRGELAAIAARFARQMGAAGAIEVDFSDISDHWANEDISRVVNVGWVNGYPDGTFKPDNFITRAEFITLVNNILERVPESADDLLADEMTTWHDNANIDEWYYLAIQEATNSHLSLYKDGRAISGKMFEYELWADMEDNPDWIQLEKEWIERYSSL